MILRDYQKQAITACFQYLTENPDKAPLIVIPTGGGKSLIIAEIIRKVISIKPDRRFLMLTHVKELVEQNYLEFINLAPDISAGIYSAGLGKKESWQSVVFGTVQSFINNDDHLFFHGLIIDEAHLVPPKGEGQYQKVLAKLKAENKTIKLIGLTATPWRLGSGLLTDDAGPFDDICYESHIGDLVRENYLAPLVSRKANATPEGIKELKVKNGEFIPSQQTKLFSGSHAACQEMTRLAGNRKKWLVFCPTIEVAEEVTTILKNMDVQAVCLHSNIEKGQRQTIIKEFKEAIEQVVLVNVNILTTGFNVPSVDMVVLYRATKSKNLFVQMVGRGARKAENKLDCMVLDYGENIDRHGSVDGLKMKRLVCPECGIYQALNNKRCIECDYEFPKVCPQCKFENKQAAIICEECKVPFGKRECINNGCGHFNPLNAKFCEKCGTEFELGKKNLEQQASDKPILSSEPIEPFEVTVRYELYAPEGKPPMVRVDYFSLNGSFVVSEYLCFSHQSKAADIARWWVKKLVNNDKVYYQLKDKLSNSWAAIEFLRNYKRKPLKIKTTKQKDSRYKKVTIMGFTEEASSNNEFRDNGNTVISKDEVMAEGKGKVLSVQSDHIIVDFGGKIERHPYRNGFIPKQKVILHNGALLPCPQR